MTLSVVIITKNEAANIQRCLNSVSFADERIVYDTGSTDSTVALARENSANVIAGYFDGFGTTKQRAWECATGDWILSLDADEEVSSELAEQIKTGIGQSHNSGFECNRLTLFLGRWIRHGGWYPDRVVRLARRGRARFSDRLVHEGLIVEGQIGHLGGDLLHYSYPTLEGYFAKGEFYTTLGAENLHREKSRMNTVGWYDLAIRPWWLFVKQYILRAGFMDGWQGFVLAALSSMQVLTKYAKLKVRQSEQQS